MGRWGDGEMQRQGEQGENNQCPMPRAQCPNDEYTALCDPRSHKNS
ncbi:hypothetical protein [Nostoc sp. FACHB-857]|uniref:Uncharacterized protein n=1 Tax=Nostoc paludosum FACHB-159 TaxID=2692908 RepID=A0ABR8KI09_9NOSO|nr:hypothetical protein [Nostoc sp. FACHB-857]MBD2738369.1 hypothetical protein [Nostoc paludosum FACHB-159]